ncbi:Hypothetical predicted protein [Podarcis lilfordi]|uniref:Uncharacterized protein n=1 Tax=Podarcis lilfordi TaxID=74358 RepID=A0AA35L626_9SAUR|nr:Hypothetical predicted protein [Podarcis lilfordi]
MAAYQLEPERQPPKTGRCKENVICWERSLTDGDTRSIDPQHPSDFGDWGLLTKTSR